MPGYLVDLCRWLPDASSGTTELIIAKAIRKLMREGVAFLHLGFVPFILSGEEYPVGNKTVAWLGRMLRPGFSIGNSSLLVTFRCELSSIFCALPDRCSQFHGRWCMVHQSRMFTRSGCC